MPADGTVKIVPFMGNDGEDGGGRDDGIAKTWKTPIKKMTPMDDDKGTEEDDEIMHYFKSLVNTRIVKDFLNDTSLHGLKYLVKDGTHFCEKLSWLILTLSSWGFGAFMISFVINIRVVFIMIR